MTDQFNRRHFLAVSGAALATASAARADEIDPEVAAEMARRLKFLSPPDGTPPDLLARPSPSSTPFNTPAFIPPRPVPLLDLSKFTFPATLAKLPATARAKIDDLLFDRDRRRLAESDQAWLVMFRYKFRETARFMAALGIDIGDPPDPWAHQRFFEFKPQKVYVYWECEFRWRFSEDYGPDSWSWGFASFCKKDEVAHYRSACQFDLKKILGPRVQGVPIFNGGEFFPSSPGPTFAAVYGQPVLVRRVNALPEILNDEGNENLIRAQLRAEFIESGESPEDATIKAWEKWETDYQKHFPRRNIRFALPSTTTHLHNAHTASESDGHPNDWINPGEYWDHHYGNFPSGYDNREKLSTLWYHDHRMDFTASNVYAGLDGFYSLFDPAENPNGNGLPDGELEDVDDETRGWRLPSGKYDVPLILHDLLFDREKNPNGTAVEAASPQLVFDGFNTDGIIGDRFTVNRIIQPTMKVEPRKYRFRILNGGPSRFYELFLHSTSQPEALPFIAIAGDGNFQPNPLIVGSLYFGVAQRCDVIIDFSQFENGEQVYLVNQLEQINGRGPSGRTLQREDFKDSEQFFNQCAMMRFEVEAAPDHEVDTDTSESRFPLHFRDFPPVDLTEVRRERLWEFDFDGGLWTINGQIYDPNRIDAGIELGTAEIWTFRNVGNTWSHPIHSHFTEFIVLEINGVPQYQFTAQESEVPSDQPQFNRPRSFIDIETLEMLETRAPTGDDSQESARQFFQEYGGRLREANERLKKRQQEKDEQSPRDPGDPTPAAMAEMAGGPVALVAGTTDDPVYQAARDWLAGESGIPATVLAYSPLQFRRMLGFLEMILSGQKQSGLIDEDQIAAVRYKLFLDLVRESTPIQSGDNGALLEALKLSEVLVGSFREFLHITRALAVGAYGQLDLRGNQDRVKGDGRFMGGPRRDVALILPGWEVTVFARWKDFLGKHVMHCHNVVHEDHAMMIRWDIVPPGHGFDTPKNAERFYKLESPRIPHVQPAPEHSQAHKNDSDNGRR